MNKRVLVIILIILIGGAVVYGLTANKKTDNSAANNPNTATNTQTQQNNAASSNQTQPANTQTITYDNNGFSPQKLTARSGDTIVIQNKSSVSVQFSSDPHPLHTDDPELNQSALSPGGQQSFKVTTKGTFGFHNHLDPAQTGTIVIQ